MSGPIITLFYAGILGVLWILLASHVTQQRIKHNIGVGDGGNEDVLRAMRVQANFVELVPLALLLIAGLELAGIPGDAVHILCGVLVIGRILHAYGLASNSGPSFGRSVGTLLSWLVLLIVALWSVFWGARTLI